MRNEFSFSSMIFSLSISNSDAKNLNVSNQNQKIEDKSRLEVTVINVYSSFDLMSTLN